MFNAPTPIVKKYHNTDAGWLNDNEYIYYRQTGGQTPDDYVRRAYDPRRDKMQHVGALDRVTEDNILIVD
jgi:hypothetical protein